MTLRAFLVIVHWNQAEACLRTIGWFQDQDVDLEIAVVDNGSHPEELAALRAGLAIVTSHASVELIEERANLGFGPGANVGLRRWLSDPSGADWAFLCPHDARPGPGTLSRMLAEVAVEPLAGLACADVGDGQTPVNDPYFGGITRAGDDTPGWQDADYPHGTLMALRRSCIEEIGLFDERYFSYCEEADLGWRATRAGWKVGLIRGARVTNTHLGTAVPAVDYLQERNTLLLVRSMSGRYHVFIRLCISVLQLVSGIVTPSRRPLVFDARARVRGIADYLRGVTGPPPADLYRRRA